MLITIRDASMPASRMPVFVASCTALTNGSYLSLKVRVNAQSMILPFTWVPKSILQTSSYCILNQYLRVGMWGRKSKFQNKSSCKWHTETSCIRKSPAELCRLLHLVYSVQHSCSNYSRWEMQFPVQYPNENIKKKYYRNAEWRTVSNSLDKLRSFVLGIHLACQLRE